MSVFIGEVTTKKIPVALILILPLLIFGCQQKWYFAITNVSDPSHPHFCISSFRNCSGDGVRLDILRVSEIDSNGDEKRTMWAIELIEDSKINKFKYGTAPAGYKELMPAIPLETGKFYRTARWYYFKLTQHGENIVPEIFNHEEFSKRQRAE